VLGKNESGPPYVAEVAGGRDEREHSEPGEECSRPPLAMRARNRRPSWS